MASIENNLHDVRIALCNVGHRIAEVEQRLDDRLDSIYFYATRRGLIALWTLQRGPRHCTKLEAFEVFQPMATDNKMETLMSQIAELGTPFLSA